MQEKESNMRFGADRNSIPRDHCFASLGKANSDSQDGIFYLHLTPMQDSYKPTTERKKKSNIKRKWLTSNHQVYNIELFIQFHDMTMKMVLVHIMTYEPLHDKTNKMTVRPAKTQISLGICPVWSESSTCAKSVAKDPSFLHADSEDSDQTAQIPWLIRVFAGHTCHFVGFVMRRNILYFWHFKTINVYCLAPDN